MVNSPTARTMSSSRPLVILAWLLLLFVVSARASEVISSLEKREESFRAGEPAQQAASATAPAPATSLAEASQETNERRDSVHIQPRHLQESEPDAADTSPSDPPQENAAAAAEASDRIVRGVNAVTSRYRWYARLTYRVDDGLAFVDRNGDACGGVLISDRFVLTAAHCVWDMSNGGFSPGGLRHDAFGAAVGSVCDFNDNCGQEFVSLQATHYWVHPQWNPSKFVLDIALIRLGGSVPTTVARPAEPDLGTHFPNLIFGFDDGLRSVGYGWINDGATYPQQLQEMNAGYMPPETCERYWGRLYNGVICVYTNDDEQGLFGRGLCKGDSGSPTVIPRPEGTDIVVGVTSFGWFPCTSKDRPDVLGRVSAAASYITRVVCYPGITDVPPPWCLRHAFEGPVEFFFDDIRFFDLDRPAEFNLDGFIEAEDEAGNDLSECKEDSSTFYHPNFRKKPNKVKPCSNLAKKSPSKQEKLCTNLKADAAARCCNFCEPFFPVVREYYHATTENPNKPKKESSLGSQRQ